MFIFSFFESASKPLVTQNWEKGNNSEQEVYVWSFLVSWEKALDVLYVLKIWQESVHKQLRYSLLRRKIIIIEKRQQNQYKVFRWKRKTLLKRIFSNDNAINIRTINHCERFKIFWFISSIIQSMQDNQHVQETGY